MKKKIEALMFDGRLIGNAAFEQLLKEFQAARTLLEKSKAAKIQARSAYRAVESGDLKHSEENKLALRTAFRKAKYMQLVHRADYDLIDYRLSQWLKKWESELSAAPAPKAPRKRPAKAKSEDESGQ